MTILPSPESVPSGDRASPTDAPFWFVIPLRGRAASKDWDRVCSLLQATVRSALNQADTEFHILIACQDRPDLGDISDDRVEILQGAFPTPTSLLEQSHDKQAKKRLAAAEIGKRGGGYVMLLDSDDFVSTRLVGYVRQNRHPHGYYIAQGFEYFQADKVIRPLDNFHRRCGSSYILHLTPEDLPKDLDDPATTAFDRFTNHRLVVETAAELGWDLAPVPFPAAVYLLENGENHSLQVKSAKRRLSRHKVRALIDRVVRQWGLARGKVSPELMAEFALR